MANYKGIIKSVLPPLFFNLKDLIWSSSSGWFGNYETWEDALNASSGYDQDEIFSKVKEASLLVKKGVFPYERDSVVFDKVEYSWPLLASLMWISSLNRGNLNVIDFGGSLGSSYFQNKVFLMHLKDVKWHIVEQKRFVEIGKAFFEDERLKFHSDIETCLKFSYSDTLLLGCVLPYLEKPKEFIEYFQSFNFKHIIIDRTPFIKGPSDRLTIQRVNPKIYKASYPSWFFSESAFLSLFTQKYEIVEMYNCPDVANIESEYKGLILKLKE